MTGIDRDLGRFVSGCARGPRHHPVRRTGPRGCDDAVIDAGGEINAGWTQSAIAGLYGFSTLYDQGRLGYGQTVALAEVDPHSDAEIATFERCYGVTTPVSRVEVDGGTGVPADQQVGEAALDIEQVASLAPGSSVLTYDGPNDGSGLSDIFGAIADDDRAQVVSASLGGCESSMTPAEATTEAAIFAQMAAQGQTVAVATGDSGSEGAETPRTRSLSTTRRPRRTFWRLAGRRCCSGSSAPPTSTPGTTATCRISAAPTPPTAPSMPIGINRAPAREGSPPCSMPAWQQAAGNGTINPYSRTAPCPPRRFLLPGGP